MFEEKTQQALHLQLKLSAVGLFKILKLLGVDFYRIRQRELWFHICGHRQNPVTVVLALQCHHRKRLPCFYLQCLLLLGASILEEDPQQLLNHPPCVANPVPCLLVHCKAR
ncbi:hypothetical protein C4D60_Mb01t08700 [Musa balbisiana]|uniref:Uncharacterized protein n=1 Tax=Musa balbisiana TaxID=52838 RepID=A0A4V4H784_MUSBA|nr:hypothetical protein C4D60_Mb01t08700 [Musa balbisiana]